MRNLIRNAVAILALSISYGTPQLASAQNFVVLSPTGTDDTANIQHAFDTVTAPGSIYEGVWLRAGYYRVSEPIFVENFSGELRGDSQDSTIVELSKGANGELFPRTQLEELPGYEEAILFHFKNPSRLFVTDITFQNMIDGLIDGPWGLWSFFHIVQSAPSEIVFQKTSFRGFGTPGSNEFLVPGIAVHVFGANNGSVADLPIWSGGSITIEESYFEGILAGYRDEFMSGAKITIGGTEKTKNIFVNALWGMIAHWDSDCLYKVTHNEMTGLTLSGVAFRNNVAIIGATRVPALSTLLIAHNSIEGGTRGILIWDEDHLANGLPPTINATIRNNRVSDARDRGIDIVGLDGAIVARNSVTGESFFGIQAYGAVNATLLGNNLENVDALAPIILRGGTRDSTVVGGHNQVNVWDFGLNNTLVGVNNMGGNPPGPELQDAMDDLAEMESYFRRR